MLLPPLVFRNDNTVVPLFDLQQKKPQIISVIRS